MTAYLAPRMLDAGEAALTVEFGDSVDSAINARVLALDAALRAAPPPGVLETVPTYRSLTIHYEPLILPRAALAARVTELAANGGAATPVSGAVWTLPCCYAPPLAEDIIEAASVLGLSAQDVAQRHAQTTFRAYMYGFAPGWCYLGGLPESLATPRRASPRGPTPPGAVLIGGGLSLIGADPMPTGWYVLGRTPERLFSAGRPQNFLIEPGDTVRFAPIDPDAFAALEARVAAGEIVARREAP